MSGTTICEGIGSGAARITQGDIEVSRRHIETGEIESETGRYTAAVGQVIDTLHTHIAECHDCSLYDTSQIFKVHELIARDESFHGAVRARIRSRQITAEWALVEESENIIAKLRYSRDSYLQARVEDVLDLVNNVLTVLSSPSDAVTGASPIPADGLVLVSSHLYTSQIIRANRARIHGFATESGALSSHAAILLRSFGIPAVGGVKGLLQSVEDGDGMVVDGFQGKIIIRPCAATQRRYQLLLRGRTPPAERVETRRLGTRTRDGTLVRLLANIDNNHQVELVRLHMLEGIGLFRTEFLVLTANRFPTEDEQYLVYSKVFETLAGGHPIFRTFDLGSDKVMTGLERCAGKNPALGVRGIRRHLMHHPDELHAQLRALLRAAAGRTVGILFPMVTTMSDVIEIKEHVTMVEQNLRMEETDLASDVKLGAMIEVPSAAIAVGDILREVDFVSVGTNDLIQYFMAADRDNEEVLRYSDAANSSFLYLLRYIIDRAADMGRADDVTICGEMASDVALVPRLIRMGYRKLSISPVAARSIREIISRIDLDADTEEAAP